MKATRRLNLLAASSLALGAATCALVSGCSPSSPPTMTAKPPMLPPPNPYLMAGSFYPQTHWNSAASDVTPLPAWLGNHVVGKDQVQWIPAMPALGSAHYPYPGGEQAMFISGANRVGKIRITGGAFELIDQVIIPGSKTPPASEAEIRQLVGEIEAAGGDEARFLPQFQSYLKRHEISTKTVTNGTYTALDKDGNYYAGWGTTMYKVADERPGDVRSPLKIVKSFDLRAGLRPDEAKKISRMTGFTITYDGHLVVAMSGIVAVLDRALDTMQYQILEDEAIDNGVSTDPEGGIYVVTSKYMRKLVWNGTRLSADETDGAWKEPYDIVPNPKALSRGAGNTPTLMGFGKDADRLVIIADAGNPVKIVAFWRDKIPEGFPQVKGTSSRRIAAQLPIRFNPPATIEFSPHVYGYGVMMFASAFTDPVMTDGAFDYFGTLYTSGVSRAAPRGSEKWTWHPESHTLTSDWLTDVPMQPVLYPVSAASNTVGLCALEAGVYSLVFIDWDTGRQVGKTTLGTNPIFNAAGAFFIPMDNGDIYVGGGFGQTRITKEVDR